MRRSRASASIAFAVVCSLLLVVPKADAATLTGTGNSDTVFGTKGKDTLSGGDGIDFIFGKNNPKSILRGGRRVPAPDTLHGNGDTDVVFGGPGKDKLYGDDSADTLRDDDGSPGDLLLGGGGADQLFSADGAIDKVDCGGDDVGDLAVVDQNDVVTGCALVIAANRTADGITYVFGSDLGGPTTGTSDSEVIFGRGGSDVIDGGDGDDALFGGTGVDTLNGQIGVDRLIDDDGTGGDNLYSFDDQDIIYTADGGEDNVTCSGGGANTLVFADPVDHLSGCTNVRVGDGQVTQGL